MHEDELAALGSVALADPFETFAHQLVLALRAPPLHTLNEWLVGARGASLDHNVSYHPGTWVPALENFVKPLPERTRDQVLGGNVRRLYGI